ncbi:MAG: DHHA1 domain-containing protein, partial [Microbacterium sp.]
EAAALQRRAPEIAGRAAAAGRFVLVAESVGEIGSADDVRSLATQVRERLGSEPGIVALAGESSGRPVVVVATTEAARAAGARAGDLVKAASGALGGGGGGKPDLAQGGGTDAAAIPSALETVRRAVEDLPA